MKVAVFGIDGLDANLVLKWRLKTFMQKYYGTHDVKVAIKPGDPLYTPLIWAAFLLGKPAYSYDFDQKLIAMRRAQKGYNIPEKLYRIRLKLFGSRKLGLRSLLMRLGFYDVRRVIEQAHEVEVLPREALKDSLPEVAKNMGYRVWVKEFPSYNDLRYAEWRARAFEFSGISVDEVINELDKGYRYSVELLREAMEAAKDSDLILYYTPVIDWANHKFYKPGKMKPMTLLATYYKRVDKTLSEVIKQIPDSVILILSDHGFDPKTREHSSSGFWSMNVKPPYNPKTILDFKELVLRMLTHYST